MAIHLSVNAMREPPSVAPSHQRAIPELIEQPGDDVTFFCPIAKTTRTNKGLMVYGWASAAEYLDDQGEIVDSEALRAAVEDWSAWRNIRLMHQPDPIGVAPVVEIRRHPATGCDGLWLGAHIVDERAIRLIESGVLKGFSIGGQCLERVAEVVGA